MTDLAKLPAITPALLRTVRPYVSEADAKKFLDEQVGCGALVRSRHNGQWVYKAPGRLPSLDERPKPPKPKPVHKRARQNQVIALLREHGKMTTTVLGKHLFPDFATVTKDDVRMLRNRAQAALDPMLRAKRVARERLKNGIFQYWLTEDRS